MPIKEMNCPVCKNPATEYDINKWKCLVCQTKFIYEPPVTPVTTVTDAIIQKINIENFEKNSLIFLCDSCKTNFSYLNNPMQNCRFCHKPFSTCLNCFKSTKHMNRWLGDINFNFYGFPPQTCYDCLNKVIDFILSEKLEKRKSLKNANFLKKLFYCENTSINFYYTYITGGQYLENFGKYTTESALKTLDEVFRDMGVIEKEGKIK